MSTDFPTPLSTVDVVLFTLFADTGLHVLLSTRPAENDPFPGRKALPGGFVHTQEDQNLDATAVRLIAQKAAISQPLYLEQLQTFSGSTRDPRGWSISQAYCGIVPQDVQDSVAKDMSWTPVETVDFPSLAFDHADILAKALERVRNKTSYSLLPAHFLGNTFTLTELQHVYESVLGVKLDKSAFRKRIDALNAFTSVTGEQRTGRQRPAQLYKLKSISKNSVPFFRSTI
jgi:8-oxo-dGTP diphosphatase